MTPRTLAPLLAAAMLAGCQTYQTMTEIPPEPVPGPTPTCSSSAECDAKWSAARLYLIHLGGNRIDRDTADYIFTANTNDASLSAQVTREPVSAGVYRIVAVFGCYGASNAKGCLPTSPQAALARFNSALNAIGEKP